MKIAALLRYKIDNDKDGIFYITDANIKMFKDKGVELVLINDINNVENIVKECAFLYVPGGVDVDPKYYREEINGTKDHYDFLDELDMTYIKAFYDANKPILGICRGLQIINVTFGGSLYQDIKNHGYQHHDITIEKDSFLDEIYNSKTLNVNSLHHQAIKDLAPNFKIVARASDGTIEAIQDKNIYAVQWHPELIDSERFINYFINKFLK